MIQFKKGILSLFVALCLLLSACEFLPSSAPGEPWVRVTVTDEGATIPPHKLEAIFDKFFRLDESRATRTGGAGLGLAIARQIVELHGGTITAESADEHIVFTLQLPLAPAKAAALPDAAAARKS